MSRTNICSYQNVGIDNIDIAVLCAVPFTVIHLVIKINLMTSHLDNAIRQRLRQRFITPTFIAESITDTIYLGLTVKPRSLFNSRCNWLYFVFYLENDSHQAFHNRIWSDFTVFSCRPIELHAINLVHQIVILQTIVFICSTEAYLSHTDKSIVTWCVPNYKRTQDDIQYMKITKQYLL